MAAMRTQLNVYDMRFTENGATRIGVIKPAAMLAALSDEPALAEIAQQVEDKIIQMVEEAK